MATTIGISNLETNKQQKNKNFDTSSEANTLWERVNKTQPQYSQTGIAYPLIYYSLPNILMFKKGLRTYTIS